MVRVASGGAGQEDPNAAMLQGVQLGRAFRAAQADRAAAANAQMGRQIQMQELYLRIAKFKQDRDEALVKAANEGSLAALQELALQSKKSPSQEFADAADIMFRNMDPETKKSAYPIMKEILGHLEREEQTQAFNEKLGDVLKSGTLDEAGQLQMQDDVAKGLMTPQQANNQLTAMQRKAANKQTWRKENEKALANMQVLIEMQPEQYTGKARALLNEALMSPSKMEKQGFGAQQAQEIQFKLEDALKAKREAYKKGQEGRAKTVEALRKAEAASDDREVERLRKALGFGVYGPDVENMPQEPRALFGNKPNKGEGDVFMVGEQDAFDVETGKLDPSKVTPPTPGMIRHTAFQKQEKERRYPGSTARKGKTAAAASASQTPVAASAAGVAPDISQASTPDDIKKALRAAGVPLTQSNLKAALERWRGGR